MKNAGDAGSLAEGLFQLDRRSAPIFAEDIPHRVADFARCRVGFHRVD
ncbi:MAG: hypothetical protein ACI944_000873, partial [Natronomonas sp.]